MKKAILFELPSQYVLIQEDGTAEFTKTRYRASALAQNLEIESVEVKQWSSLQEFMSAVSSLSESSSQNSERSRSRSEKATAKNN